MGDRAHLNPNPGGPFEVDIKGTPVRGHYLHLDPPHRLVISWGYAGSTVLPPDASTVDIRLVAEGTGTRVELQHHGLPSAEHPGVLGKVDLGIDAEGRIISFTPDSSMPVICWIRCSTAWKAANTARL
jgi:uncharacterized protein YndB with AHSA1/START domain